MFPAFCGCRYIDFQTGHFAGFEQFKVDIHSANFGQIEGEPISSLLWTVAGHNYLTSLGKAYHRKQSKPSLIKIEEPPVGSGTSQFQ